MLSHNMSVTDRQTTTMPKARPSLKYGQLKMDRLQETGRQN